MLGSNTRVAAALLPIRALRKWADSGGTDSVVPAPFTYVSASCSGRRTRLAPYHSVEAPVSPVPEYRLGSRMRLFSRRANRAAIVPDPASMPSRFVGLPALLGPRLQPRDGRELPVDALPLLLGGLLPLGCAQYDPWPSVGDGLSATQSSGTTSAAAFSLP